MKDLTDGAIARIYMGWEDSHSVSDDDCLKALMDSHDNDSGEQIIHEARRIIEADRGLSSIRVPAAIRLFDGDLDYRSEDERFEKARMLLGNDGSMSVHPHEDSGWYASINGNEYHGYDEADAILKCQAALVDQHYRLMEAVGRAKSAFMEALAQSYPEISAVELEPHVEMQLYQAAQVVSAQWFQANQPVIVHEKTVDDSSDLSM